MRLEEHLKISGTCIAQVKQSINVKVLMHTITQAKQQVIQHIYLIHLQISHYITQSSPRCIPIFSSPVLRCSISSFFGPVQSTLRVGNLTGLQDFLGPGRLRDIAVARVLHVVAEARLLLFQLGAALGCWRRLRGHERRRAGFELRRVALCLRSRHQLATHYERRHEKRGDKRRRSLPRHSHY